MKKKHKSVSGNQSTPQQTNTVVFFCQQTVHLYPQWARQEKKARSARVAACVRRGFTLAHAGYDSNKRHKQKAVVSTPKWTWMAPPKWAAFHRISTYMTCCGLNGRLDEKSINLKAKTTQWPYLLVNWQCDVQVAYGSLRKAFSRFWLFQEGEAATRLLAHVSDLKQVFVIFCIQTIIFFYKPLDDI